MHCLKEGGKNFRLQDRSMHAQTAAQARPSRRLNPAMLLTAAIVLLYWRRKHSIETCLLHPRQNTRGPL